jgi:transcriptional/translational regulatory protein YebC/TACO1
MAGHYKWGNIKYRNGPHHKVKLDVVDADQVIRLVDMFEDLEDVQNVYSNGDFSQELLAYCPEPMLNS